MVIYFDDILIYSSNNEDHIHHLSSVLTILQQNELFINFKKYDFMTSNLIFIGYIIVADGIKVDEDKIKAIKE